MEELFAPEISTYDFRNNNSFWRRVNSVWHSTDSVSYIGPKRLDLVPTEIKRNLDLSMISNSKSKGGSLKDVLTYKTRFQGSKITMLPLLSLCRSALSFLSYI